MFVVASTTIAAVLPCTSPEGCPRYWTEGLAQTITKLVVAICSWILSFGILQLIFHKKMLGPVIKLIVK